MLSTTNGVFVHACIYIYIYIYTNICMCMCPYYDNDRLNARSNRAGASPSNSMPP